MIDNSNEVRVFGPPGTGKTTWLAGSIMKTASTRQTSRIMVASFTRAAAAEIAGRGLPLDKSSVGTLHSLAYRSVGHPQVAQEVVGDWNRRHPAIALTNSYRTREGMEEMAPAEFTGETDGDRTLAELDALRARLVPREVWPMRVQSFHRKWERWKQEEQVVDFTDMIELALHNTTEAPGAPLVGFFDEVQDFTPLELALVRHWGARMERIVLAGDDDQAIYQFKGASPDAFLDPPIADDRKWILDQSWRVPRQVHAVAQHWVERLSRREPKLYRPRDEEGLVRTADLRWQDPAPVVRDLLGQVDQGRTVMVLSTCSYMLDPIKHELRKNGVPFHNPYRSGRMDWNPLRASRGTSAADKLLAYLILDERMFGAYSREWTGRDVRTWAAAVRKQGVFRRGAAGAIAGLPDRTLTYEEVESLFDDPKQLEQALEPSLEWFASNLLAGQRATMEYPINVVRRRGSQALLDVPRVCLGTIHSVKGGQADTVYLISDLSIAGMREWSERRTRDSVVRQMYVGMTRARQELVLCSNSSQYAVPPELMYSGGGSRV